MINARVADEVRPSELNADADSAIRLRWIPGDGLAEFKNPADGGFGIAGV